MLNLIEHRSSSYKPRTEHNAATGHVTVAFAAQFGTPGERLTKKAAGDRHLGIDISMDPIEAARLLYKKVRAAEGRILNVAGNGIATLSNHGWTQRQVNLHLYKAIAKVHEHLPFERVISGGQTGVDWAGGVAGVVLGIPTAMTFPNGFRQRPEDGIDRTYTKEEILQQFEADVAQLKQDLANQLGQPTI